MADSGADRAKIQEEIKVQGTVVRQLKTDKAPKEKVCLTSFCLYLLNGLYRVIVQGILVRNLCHMLGLGLQRCWRVVVGLPVGHIVIIY